MAGEGHDWWAQTAGGTGLSAPLLSLAAATLHPAPAMSLLQSALDFLAGPGSLGAASRDQNDFVGQVVEMGEMKLRIKKVIAEGGSGWPGRERDGRGGGRKRCVPPGVLSRSWPSSSSPAPVQPPHLPCPPSSHRPCLLSSPHPR